MKLNCLNHRLIPSPTAAEKSEAGQSISANHSQRGIALVITLVMLSVTLVMAIAFLALARRERSSVSTTTDTTTAKLAADSALAAAQSQILANVLSEASNTYNFGLLVSTNYINTNGFWPSLPFLTSPLNVNYNHEFGMPTPLTPGEFLQNVANLQYLPRAPVFIQTNAAGSNDFRFYLDLNRNGNFDDTAYIDNRFTNGPISEVGDPQWIGILARPDMPHSANNQFLARYAFIALPIGNTLDINAIHNQTLNSSINPSQAMDLTQDGFFRNESVGSWEINLAAFLADLNSDEWDPQGNLYNYNEALFPPSANSGAAFEDAFAILTNRYAGFYASLAVPGAGVLPPNISLFDALVNQGIDGYTIGNLMTSPQRPAVIVPRNRPPWAGSDNTNHFYNLPSDLFNPSETSGDFVKRLTAAGNSIGVNGIGTNYDRYTFYHLLAQLGTDSDPDDGKMNLNYRNVTTNGVVVPNMETNCFVWSPIEFFTNAADRMLRLYSTNWFAASPYNYLQTYYGFLPGNYSEYYANPSGTIVTNNPNGFGLTNFLMSSSRFLNWTNAVPAISITNIPVYINGTFVYSPAVNRILQLAANLYDASTNSFYPSVFRPVFELDQFTNLFIVGYTNVVPVIPLNPGSDTQFQSIYDVTDLGANFSFFGTYRPLVLNIYGVPWIIGAKKNLPAFNQLSMLNTVQVSRRLQVGRNVQDGPVYTNHMYQLSIANSIGASFWNSYSNDYVSPGNGLTVLFSDKLEMVVTNSDHPGTLSTQIVTNSFILNTNFWPGSHWSYRLGQLPANNSFIGSTWTNIFFPSGYVIYKTGAKTFAQPTDDDLFETNNISCDLLPQLGLLTTNWMRAIIVDNGHVIDYVQLRGPIDGTNFTATLADPPTTSQPYLWSTNAYGSGSTPSWGYVSQINISEGSGTAPVGATWIPVQYPDGNSLAAATAYFKAFFGPAPHSFTFQGTTYYATSLVVQAGYTAIRTNFVSYLYQVNDPMVHYLASDLDAGKGAVWDNGPVPNGVWSQNNGVVGATPPVASYPVPIPPFGQDIIKGRYQPWGAKAPIAFPSPAFDFGNVYNASYRDPGVWGSDYWSFPTNRYPTVGWIGRVHRGSPWQTVYLKSKDVVVAGNVDGTNTWSAWTGDGNLYDAANSGPAQDRLLFDLFTTRLNDNGARGTLSVNQTNLAAWSALFSGMVYLTNTTALPSFTLGAGNLIPIPTNSFDIIAPVAVGGGNSGLATLLANINIQRTNTNPQVGFTNADGTLGVFEHAGDILSTPALSLRSPFLNTNAQQQAFGISDAAYEWLPQQMMGLVRGPTTPRYVIYGYGQSLRPAQNGLVSSSSFFGLVTNYQVVAESAVRAVVSVQAHVDMSGAYPVTNYTTRVENYNVLPSD